MRTLKRFRIAQGVKDGKLQMQDIVGYEIIMPLDNKLRVFTTLGANGWLLCDMKTGCVMGARTPMPTEEDAINAFMQQINTLGIDGILQAIEGFVKNVQKDIDDFKEAEKKRKEKINVHTPTSEDSNKPKGETVSVPMSPANGVAPGEVTDVTVKTDVPNTPTLANGAGNPNITDTLTAQPEHAKKDSTDFNKEGFNG